MHEQRGKIMCMVCELKEALDSESRTEVVEKFVEKLIASSKNLTGISEVELAAFFARHFQRMTARFVEANPKPNELAKLAAVLEMLYEIPEESREFARKAFDPKLN